MKYIILDTELNITIICNAEEFNLINSNKEENLLKICNIRTSNMNNNSFVIDNSNMSKKLKTAEKNVVMQYHKDRKDESPIVMSAKQYVVLYKLLNNGENLFLSKFKKDWL